MTTKTAFLIVRLSPETKKKAEKKAKQMKVTLSNWARQAIDSFIDA